MNNRKQVKVIITDVESRKAFDVVNIIKRVYKYDCILCAGKDTVFQLPLIYGAKIHKLRGRSYEFFIEDFIKIIEKYKEYELVYIPVSEKPTRHFLRLLMDREIPKIHFLLPSLEYFNLCSDKFNFQKYCEQWNFPVPESYCQNDLLIIKDNFKPLILKPRSGQGSVGIIHIDKKSDLEVLDSINWDEYILQQKIKSSNKVAGTFFMCKKGEVISSYSHQRLRTFPTEGGVTVYSKSTKIDEIIEIGAKVLKKLDWNGLAMIEFMYDNATNSWKIIELNPRIWGSILLSEFNNSRLLDIYIKESLDDKVELKLQLKESYIRWLFPFDLMNWLKADIKSNEFFKLNLKTTCYINFTYASIYNSLLFLCYFTINFSSIKRFLLKLKG